jgi:putative flippase GtrA
MENFQDKHKKGGDTAARYFGFFMILVYLGVGLWLIISGTNIGRMNKTTRLVFGILLILYSLIRVYQAYKIIKNGRSD